MPLGAERCAMADYLFVPQSVLDQWSEKGRVEVKGHVLILLREKKSFQLTSAVRFLKMEAGEDLKGLLHKVKTLGAHLLERIEGLHLVKQPFEVLAGLHLEETHRAGQLERLLLAQQDEDVALH